MNQEQIKLMFTEEHLTTRQIGKLLGVSNATVHRHLKLMGVKAEDGERVWLKCEQCGVDFWLHRSRWRKTIQPRCSAECYMAAIHNPNYFESRDGKRIARKVVSERFPLREGNVVHHVDSDNTHNDIRNLWVFATQADHMAWHRGRKEIQPIWRGDWLS